MIALISVECPYCHARGNVLMSPGSFIIIGPCPECNQKIAIFWGQALALDTQIMSTASGEEKVRHVLKVLTSFLAKRLEELLLTDSASSDSEQFEPEANPWPKADEITAQLEMLDDAEAFKKLFGQPPRI